MQAKLLDSLDKVLEKLSGWLEQMILMLPNLAVAVVSVLALWLLARTARSLSFELPRPCLTSY